MVIQLHGVNDNKAESAAPKHIILLVFFAQTPSTAFYQDFFSYTPLSVFGSPGKLCLLL
jgi:hypothetical protein